MIIKCEKQTDGRINLSFLYDTELLKEIKNLNYRKWNPENKTWTILPNGLSVLISLFPDYKFDYNFTLEDTNPEFEIVQDIDKGTIKIENDNLPFINDKSYQRLSYIGNLSGIYRLQNILKQHGYNYQLPNYFKNERKNIELHPQGFELYPYQQECVDFFKQHNWSGINALSMGLGKTITSLMCFYESNAKNLMIVAPSGLLQQWADVIKENFGCKATIVNSKTKKEDRKELLTKEPIVITSFDILWREEDYFITDMLIIDEASKIKNWKTKRAQALHNIVSKYRMALTGTPIENRLSELFNIADNAVPAFYGSLGVFYQKYTQQEHGETLPIESLYKKNKELLFRKTQEDVSDELPDKTIMELYTDLTPREKRCANEIKSQDKEAIGILAMLKVHASNPAIYMKDLEQSSKEKLLEGLLTDDLVGRKCVVFTQYKKNIPRFKKIANDNGIKALYLSADNSKELEIIRDRFVKEDYDVLFLTEVGEFGLDKLQVADVLINVDLPYNPSRLHQRIGRIHRLGSKHNNVLVINLISSGTLDDYLIKILNGKIKISDLAVSGVKSYLMKELDLKDKDLKI